MVGVLTNIEERMMFLKVGEEIKKFLVCSICKDDLGVKHNSIDVIKFCNDKNTAKEKKKKLKREFSKNDVKIFKIEFKMIE